MAAPTLALAAGNRNAVEAATGLAGDGGNAVDVCLAAAIMAWVAEPFMASLGGSGFIVVRTPDGGVEIYDGNNAMTLSHPTEPGQGIRRIYFAEYANGMFTGIGGGSVAVPGILAAIHAAWERHGSLPWQDLFAPAIAAARSGISFPHTSAFYLSATYKELWALYPTARSLLIPNGSTMAEGETFLQPELAESLQLVADEGPTAFYSGALGMEITDAIAADGGFMTIDDLTAYEAKVREPISTDVFGWRVDSNPPPAVGGAVLTHMLALLEEATLDDPIERVRALVEAESGAVGYRNERYEDPSGIAGALEDALARLRSRRSSSTTHMSAADASGYACSLTESNGYSSGLIVHGIFLNNTLGEEELNPGGPHGLPAGARCHSNMAPTIATGAQGVVALGSPGADRIVGAIAQTLVAIAVDGKPLREAIDAPRVHLQRRPEGDLLCYERGAPGAAFTEYQQRLYETPHMFFGAVQAASVADDGTVDAAYDRRRSGAAAVV